uniref:Uncharacterized protein n=1 Tax=Trichuris muris TaxID=70415 RepID=A0A5S6QFT2_TRIMR
MIWSCRLISKCGTMNTTDVNIFKCCVYMHINI